MPTMSLATIACLSGDCFGYTTIITASMSWTFTKGEKRSIAWFDATSIIYTTIDSTRRVLF